MPINITVDHTSDDDQSSTSASSSHYIYDLRHNPETGYYDAADSESESEDEIPRVIHRQPSNSYQPPYAEDYNSDEENHKVDAICCNT